MDLIQHHFQGLDAKQKEQYSALPNLYQHWNDQINVISRKDIPFLAERHVLHSLAIAKIWKPAAGNSVLDIGTGGGFPGIPLAIMFPDVQFHLVDSIGKKIKVVQEVATALGLKNVKAEHARVETLRNKYEMIVSRAVAKANELQNWTRKNVPKNGKSGNLQSGWLLLKGGDLDEELMATQGSYTEFDLSNWFDGEFFETKKLIHLVL